MCASLLNRLAIMELNPLKKIVPFIYISETSSNVQVSIPHDFYIHHDHFYTNNQLIFEENKFIWKPTLYFKDGFDKKILFSEFLCEKYNIRNIIEKK